MHRIRNWRATATELGIYLTLALGVLSGESKAQEEHGLQIGQKAPAFLLKNQSGKDLSLAELLKQGPVALVFHRSADW